MNIADKRILIIEDHPIASHVITTSLLALDSSLNITVAACFDTALEALLTGEMNEPWFRIFLDLDMSGAQGLSLLDRCAELNLSQRCIAIINPRHPQRIVEVKKVGVLGFIEKNLLLQDFKNGLVSALKGQSACLENSSSLIAAALLSSIQKEMLCLLQRGFSSQGIAAQLGLDLETVENYVMRLMRTFPASGRMHAAAMAIELAHLECTRNQY